jgi:peptidoglycan/xylan/chitin deacetylase (PgdA/CDA1 family)
LTASWLLLALVLAPVDAGEAPVSPPDGGLSASATPAKPPAAATFAIRAVDTSEPVVALTFDACATLRQPNGFDRRVFKILAAEQIPATLYLSGRWVEKHPAAVKAIAAAPFLELGNHSYSHPRLTLVRKARLRWQIRSTNRLLEKKLGRKPLSLRPPAGAWNARVVAAASRENLPVVTWSVVSRDAGGHVPPARMVRSVLDQAKPGSIIIFHINRREPFARKALPGVIAGLRDKGFRFVTVSQLLALADATPEPARPSRFGLHRRKMPHAAEPANAAPGSATHSQGAGHANPPT